MGDLHHNTLDKFFLYFFFWIKIHNIDFNYIFKQNIKAIISDPIYSSFRFYFPKSFIFDPVREKFDKYFRAINLPYRDIVDYLNSTVINAKLPGIRDNGTRPQTHSQGRTRTFPTALQTKELLIKEVSISFQLKNSYLNWLILYSQFVAHMDRVEKTKVFLPDVNLQIFDDEDNILIELIYKEVQIRSISDIDFRKQDVGLVTREFEMVLAFNDFDIKFNMDNTQSNRDSNKHEY